MRIHKSFGLDLGTTNSTASVILNGKVVFAEENKTTKNKIIPSIYAIRNNGEEIFGNLAKQSFYIGNSNSKKSVKRDMGKDIKYKFGELELTPEDISSKIISFCKKCLDSTINVDDNVVYDKVVITVPAYFSLAQKDATRKAGELAGLEVTMLLEEPTAAAINFAIQNDVNDGLFFVFDLGGGTFDVSILEKTGNIPQVLATAGNNFLGGDNFDLLLARYLLSYLTESGYDMSDVKADTSNPKFKCLMLIAEKMKIDLSREEVLRDVHYQDIFKDLTSRDLYIEEFSRNDFNEIIKDKIEIDVIVECDKALNILSEKHGKTIEDITHIVMVGGSSKIPYVQEIIKKKYCVTDKLTDIICFDPDLSVSAGAALVANSQGYSIEDENLNILINVNSPFIVDGQVYISGTLINGNVKSIGIQTVKRELKLDFNEDKTFLGILEEGEYSDSLTFNVYNEDNSMINITNEDNSTVDIIAPTPVQNETIAVEIIDIEKGKIEKYPIVESGVALPSESIEYFKINEYSDKQIILPIWEGPRKIFDLIIDLPEDVKIGSKISVTTKVDVISNIELEVKLEGKELKGRYEYVAQNDNSQEVVEKLDDTFNERIDYIKDENVKEELIQKKENIDRELIEASENNDLNHYTAVSEKFEKIVVEMPSEHNLTDDDFDKIGEEIKSKLTPDLSFNEYDVDNLVFYGKRFLNKNNQIEAKRCMDELEQMKASADIFSSPKMLFETAKLLTAQIVAKALSYVESYNSNPIIVEEINKELNTNIKELTKLFEKYDGDSVECEEMKHDAIRLIQLTSKLYQIMEQVTSSTDKTMAAFKGLVSKA